jgi:hypothetical protein
MWNPETPKSKAGSPDPVLHIDVPFEEAVRRLATKRVPPEGRSDFRVRQRRKKESDAPQ